MCLRVLESILNLWFESAATCLYLLFACYDLMMFLSSVGDFIKKLRSALFEKKTGLSVFDLASIKVKLFPQKQVSQQEHCPSASQCWGRDGHRHARSA